MPTPARSPTFRSVEYDLTDLPRSVQCVELADTGASRCPASKDHVKRRFGSTWVTFYTASDYSDDLTAWKTVPLTRDLTKVTWLH